MVHTNHTAIQQVISAVAEQWNITAADIIGPRRTGAIAQARQASMAICYWNGYGNLKAIAASHNRDNHGTVLHACNAVEADTRRNPQYKAKVMAVTAAL